MRVVNMELDEDFLQRFYDLTGDKVPETLTLISLKKQVLNIQERIRLTLAESGGGGTTAKKKQNKNINDDSNENEENKVNFGQKKMLLVDNLGIITYQIQMIMESLGHAVIVSKDAYNAISLFEENDYDIVMLDLLIPTEREGLILLKQLKKIADDKNAQTIIGTMSVAGKKELKTLTIEHGADFYIEKSLNWQDKLKKMIEKYLSDDDEE